MAGRVCAMEGCRQPAAPSPVVVDLATLPGRFELDLCSPCREAFEAGIEVLARVVEGDAEVVPFRFAGAEAAAEQVEAER